MPFSERLDKYIKRNSIGLTHLKYSILRKGILIFKSKRMEWNVVCCPENRNIKKKFKAYDGKTFSCRVENNERNTRF